MQRYKGDITKYRRPFWLPASNFYILAAAAAIAFFFLVWGILHDGGDSTPWIPAGIGSSVVLAAAVILREVILRSARNRFLASQRKLDMSLRAVRPRTGEMSDAGKLTLEQNAAILRQISKKSDAAKVLGKFGEGHREVYELCEEYLQAVARELPNVGVGSPRLAALRRGREVADEHRHYHLLKWAEIEARSLMSEAKSRTKAAEKLDTAQRALGAVDFAIAVYPHDPSLLDSEKVLRQFVASVKVADYVEKAERAAFKGNSKRALSLYQDALFELDRVDIGGGLDMAREKITGEIASIKQLLGTD
jgi:hypothetical protein